MHTFKPKPVAKGKIKAERLQQEMTITVNGEEQKGNVGDWLLRNDEGRMKVMSDSDFRSAYEPSGSKAKAYLESR